MTAISDLCSSILISEQENGVGSVFLTNIYKYTSSMTHRFLPKRKNIIHKTAILDLCISKTSKLKKCVENYFLVRNSLIEKWYYNLLLSKSEKIAQLLFTTCVYFVSGIKLFLGSNCHLPPPPTSLKRILLCIFKIRPFGTKIIYQNDMSHFSLLH